MDAAERFFLGVVFLSHSEADTSCRNNEAPNSGALVRDHELRSGCVVAAVRLVPAGGDVRAARAGVRGAVRPRRGQIQLEERVLHFLQSHLHAS